MVFEFAHYDLVGLLRHKDIKLSALHKKSYLHQMLAALSFMHQNNIIHRDIKGTRSVLQSRLLFSCRVCTGANVFVTQDHVVKVGDWGLARSCPPQHKQPFTNQVVSLWYRAPELLLGAVRYGPEIDIWSVGYVTSDAAVREK
jgi:cyclin-dependent kinase 12/13